jgi:hypothetical protein
MKDIDQILTNSDIDETLMKQGVCHSVALSFNIKKYLKGKRRIMETQNISPCKNIIFKKSSERNQNPSRYC